MSERIYQPSPTEDTPVAYCNAPTTSDLMEDGQKQAGAQHSSASASRLPFNVVGEMAKGVSRRYDHLYGLQVI
jgi:hypothetical protein